MNYLIQHRLDRVSLSSLFLAILLTLFIITSVYSQNLQEMAGTYKLDYTLHLESGKPFNGIEGYIIYSGSHYLAVMEKTSPEFEIGTYRQDGMQVIHRRIDGSLGALRIAKNKEIIKVVRKNGGIQLVVRDSLYERYFNRLEKGQVSPFDGAWVQLDSYSIVSGDTMSMKSIYNYKIMSNGYFGWGALHQASSEATKETHWGIGTFRLETNTVQMEKYLSSTLPGLLGSHSILLRVQMTDSNIIKQTIQDTSNGFYYVEVYRRLD